MKNQMLEKMEQAKEKLQGVAKKGIDKMKVYASAVMLAVMTAPIATYAAADADASWNTVMDFLLTWIPRLGGVLLFIGGVEFAIAYKNEDANSKTNATRLMVSGAMVIALPVALGSLLKA